MATTKQKAPAKTILVVDGNSFSGYTIRKLSQRDGGVPASLFEVELWLEFNEREQELLSRIHELESTKAVLERRLAGLEKNHKDDESNRTNRRKRPEKAGAVDGPDQREVAD